MRATHLAWIAVAATACSPTRPLLWDRDRTVLGPIPLKTQIAYVDSARDRVTLVEIGGDTPTLASVRIGRNAMYAMPSPDRHHLFVVTRGEEKIKKGMIDQPPMLWMVDTQHPDVQPFAYQIGSPFDRIAISPDNTIAVTYFSASGPDDAGFFRNPNELAIVDLSRPADTTNPTLRSLRAFGSVPTGITLSPPMTVPGAADPTPRTFAFVLAPNDLTVLDTSHPDRREISMRLDAAGQNVTPQQIVFAPHTPTAYVRSDGASDVLQVLLEPDAPVDATGNDYRPLLAELGAGGGPTDIAVYDDPSGTRYLLAATPNTGVVVAIEADTGQFRSIPIADPIDRILLFPSGPDVTPHAALLASIGAKLPRLAVLDLDRIADPLVQPHIDPITLDKPVLDVVPVPDRELAMVVHDDARTVLGLLDMTTRSTSPLLGVGKLDSYDFSPDGSHLIGATAHVSRIGFVALDNLHPTDFRLDDPPAKVLSAANAKIFVDHGDARGHATIIPSPDATRDQAIVLDGFLFANLLDEEP
jgi:hypothetical protein